MPKKACCCNASGRHVAVACRYYDTHSLYWLTGSTAPGQMGLGGPDGFQGITGGYQKLFGVTSFINFGIEYFTVRGPNYPSREQQGAPENYVTVYRFDDTRDVVILSRGGGGASKYDYNSGGPKGGNAALTQGRVKADLALEAIVGTGGRGYDGGGASIVGYNISNQGNIEATIITAAGGAGAAEGFGGHGGITDGFAGTGLFAGQGGSQTAGGAAGGPFAQAGQLIYGGDGAASSGGGGGGGYYGGGGGDSNSGGGGGSSKWPPDDTSVLTGNTLQDSLFNKDGTNIGPGDVCNPFISYYKLNDSTTPLYHAGMGGGVNVFPTPGQNSLGFGYDYNSQIIGVPGVITAIWLSKYCPCNNLSKEIPDMMYICLTDAQYQTIETFKQNNNIDPSYPFIRFDLDGETYIYYGICQGVYCDNMRIVEGDLTNLVRTTIPVEDQEGNPIPLAGNADRMNDCCEAIISRPICQIIGGDCLSCNSCEVLACDYSAVKPKYCCENIEDKPDIFWSVSEGYVWESTKNKSFWYDFRTTPETLSQTSPFSTDYEQGCLPVQYTLTDDNQVPPEISELCATGQGDCDNYDRNDSGSECHIRLQGRAWSETPLNWPVSVSSTVCDKMTRQVPFVWKGDYDEYCQLAGGPYYPDDPPCCDMIPDPNATPSCMCFGCVEDSRQFSFTAPRNSFSTHETVYDTNSCPICSSTSFCPRPYVVDGSVSVSRNYIANECNREVLGFTQRIRRCSGNILSAVGLQVLSGGYINWSLCEKVVSVIGDPQIGGKGSVTVGEFISAISNNLKSGISFTINEGNLWNAERVIKDPLAPNGFFIEDTGDVVSRTVTREYPDYQETEFWFRPSQTSFIVTATVTVSDAQGNTECGAEPPSAIGGNPDCRCRSSYKKGNVGGAQYEYWSEAYYYYEHPDADRPDLYPSVFVPNYDVSSYGDFGRSYAPANVTESLCKKLDFPPEGNVTSRYTPSLCTEYEWIPPCNGWQDTTTLICTPSITKIQFA